MKIGNDTSGIANKITLNILNKEGYAVEEEEFKKKTTLDIAKYSLKENVKEGVLMSGEAIRSKHVSTK